MDYQTAKTLAGEMRKIAAEDKKKAKKSKKPSSNRGEAFGKGILLGGLGAGAAQAAGQTALVTTLKPSEAKPDVKKLKKVLGRSDIEVRPTDKIHRSSGKANPFSDMQRKIDEIMKQQRMGAKSGPVGSRNPFPSKAGSGWEGSHYSPSKLFGKDTGRAEYVTAPTRKGGEFLAHELGHASLRRGGKAARLLGNLSSLRGPLGAVGSIGGMAAALAPEDDASTAVKLAPAIPAAAWAPTLADEAISSVKGYKALKNTGKYAPEVLRHARRNLMKAFGTYGLGAAAATAPIALASYIRSKRAKEHAAKAQ